MSTMYIISAIVFATTLTSILFVIIEAIEHKRRKINLNWVLLMIVIALASVLTMVLIYHAENDLTSASVQEAYDNGYEDGKAEATYVVIDTYEDGSEPVIHIVDGNGEEWVLIADEVVNHN
jgi:hypothetical protein